jgi:TRAP-type C4-dicarboxylate transport system permease small subunit
MTIALFSKKLALTLQTLVLALGFGAFGVVATAGTALANQADCSISNSANPIGAGAACAQANGTRDDLFAQGGLFQTAANVLIFLVGAVAVLFLIIGGLRYVISNGDPKAVEAAKNTILYAIVGVIVAVLSFAAVNFVIQALNK